MSPKQEEIFQSNKKFFYFYKRGPNQYKRVLIPYTENAKEMAITQGALFFSTYRSCRHDRQLFPPARKWGDLYIRFKRTKTLSNEEFEVIKNVIRNFFSRKLKLHSLDRAKIIVLGDMGFGLSVPADYFRLRDGHPLLPNIYACVTEWFENYCAKVISEKNYIIEKGSITDIENIKNGKKYNIPLTIGEFYSFSYEEILSLSVSPKNYIGTNEETIYERIAPEILNSLIKKAQEKCLSETMDKILIKKCNFLRHSIESGFIPESTRHLLCDVLERFSPEERNFLIKKHKDRKILLSGFKPFINPEAICEKLHKAKLCFNRDCNRKSPSELLNVWANCIPFEGSTADDSELQKTKCAILILQKIKQRGICEFTRRDIHRLVRGSFPTKAEVENGLRLLEKHNLLIRFEVQNYSYPGRRPSPWFLLTPLWDGKIFPV